MQNQQKQFIVTIYVTLLYVCFVSQLFAQASFCDKGYLDANRAEFTKKPVPKLLNTTALDPGFDNFRFYFSGEIHYQKSNNDIQFALLKYLYTKQNVRILLIERGASEGWLINEYLKTGNDTLIADLSINSEKSFYRALKKFNDSLPGEKILVAGVDNEKDFFFTCRAAYRIFSSVPNASLTRNVQIFLRQNDPSKSFVFKDDIYRMDSVFKDVETFPAVYKSSLKDKYDDLLAIKNSYAALKEYDGINFNRSDTDTTYKKKRELSMFNAIISLANKYSTSNFYGQFGNFHIPLTFQKEWMKFTNVSSLACQLNNTYKNEVCVMPAIYKRSAIDLRFRHIRKEQRKMGLPASCLKAIFDVSGRNKNYIYALPAGSWNAGRFIIVNN